MTEKRYWVVRHSYLMVHELPPDWDANSVEFFYNESSHCADNEAVTIGLLATVGERVCASCSAHKAEPIQGFASQEEAHAYFGGGCSPLEASPRARLQRLLNDGVLSSEQYADELNRLEAIEALL